MTEITRFVEQWGSEPIRCAEAFSNYVQEIQGGGQDAALRQAAQLIAAALGTKQPERCAQILTRLASKPDLAASYIRAFGAADSKAATTNPSPAPESPQPEPKQTLSNRKRIHDKQQYMRKRMHVLPERTPVQFRFQPGGLRGQPTELFEGILRDISKEGVGVVGTIPEDAAAKVQTRTPVEVHLPALGERQPIRFFAQVRWLLPDRSDDSLYHFGAQFAALSKKQQEALDAFLIGMALEERKK
jgi:hypothetical protein